MTANERVAAAIRAIAAGQMVIVADDDNREAEGDFIMAAQAAQADDINQMITLGRGQVCAPMTQTIADRLDLQLQGGAIHGTAYTQSVDYIHGTTTGISTFDRSLGLRKLADSSTQPADFARPGHLFPLIAKAGGVLERRGHTEAAVDLCLLAGVAPVAVICEIMNADGTMARREALAKLAGQLGLVFLTVEEIVQYVQSKK